MRPPMLKKSSFASSSRLRCSQSSAVSDFMGHVRLRKTSSAIAGDGQPVGLRFWSAGHCQGRGEGGHGGSGRLGCKFGVQGTANGRGGGWGGAAGPAWGGRGGRTPESGVQGTARLPSRGGRRRGLAGGRGHRGAGSGGAVARAMGRTDQGGKKLVAVPCTPSPRFLIHDGSISAEAGGQHDAAG